MIDYTDSLDGMTAADVEPFFADWPRSPSPSVQLAMLRGSHRVIVARDGAEVVGFVNAISDGVLTAYLPFLAVVPEHRHRGIGHELARRMVESLRHLYMVDLICDPELASFYGPLGMRRLAGMAIRNVDVLGAADPS